jgi:hypothetical protein
VETPEQKRGSFDSQNFQKTEIGGSSISILKNCYNFFKYYKLIKN